MQRPENSSAPAANAAAREDHLKALDVPVILHAPMGSLQFDPKEYWAYVETFDLTDVEKSAWLESVWYVMASFVAWNFSSLATNSALGLEAKSPGVLPSEHSSMNQADPREIGAEERIRGHGE